jgi:hypothetical protein
MSRHGLPSAWLRAGWQRLGLDRVTAGLHAMSLSLGRRAHYRWHPRLWSNAMLQRIGPLCTGHVVNVSAWKDLDRDDRNPRRYREYFPHCRSYTITNAAGARGLEDAPQPCIPLDLREPLPDALRQRFDVVFAHTVLEHVFEMPQAVRGLAELSSDLVIVVVPFAQPVHFEPGSFGDYWRFTGMSLDGLFTPHGVRPVWSAMNVQPWWSIYLVWVGSRDPDLWRARWPQMDVDPYSAC